MKPVSRTEVSQTHDEAAARSGDPRADVAVRFATKVPETSGKVSDPDLAAVREVVAEVAEAA
jgi:hypothetical protein